MQLFPLKKHWEWPELHSSWGKCFLSNNGFLHRIFAFVFQARFWSFQQILSNQKVLNNKIQGFIDEMTKLD